MSSTSVLSKTLKLLTGTAVLSVPTGLATKWGIDLNKKSEEKEITLTDSKEPETEEELKKQLEKIKQEKTALESKVKQLEEQKSTQSGKVSNTQQSKSHENFMKETKIFLETRTKKGWGDYGFYWCAWGYSKYSCMNVIKNSNKDVKTLDDFKKELFPNG